MSAESWELCPQTPAMTGGSKRCATPEPEGATEAPENVVVFERRLHDDVRGATSFRRHFGTALFRCHRERSRLRKLNGQWKLFKKQNFDMEDSGSWCRQKVGSIAKARKCGFPTLVLQENRHPSTGRRTSRCTKGPRCQGCRNLRATGCGLRTATRLKQTQRSPTPMQRGPLQTAGTTLLPKMEV